MPALNFILKSTGATRRRSWPALNLRPLGISALALLALSWLVRRLQPTLETLASGLVLILIAGVFFLLVRESFPFFVPTTARERPEHVQADSVGADQAKVWSAAEAIKENPVPWSGSHRSDQAWAEAVAAYESAMWHLAEGKPGSRTEARTSALELARLQGLLLHASQPHLPLGLETA